MNYEDRAHLAWMQHNTKDEPTKVDWEATIAANNANAEKVDTIKRYAEYLAQVKPDKLGLILMLMQWSVNGFTWPDREVMQGVLGYTGEYDTAKPQPYMDKLREMGVPNDMLNLTVWHYPKDAEGNRMPEGLSSIKCRIIDLLMT